MTITLTGPAALAAILLLCAVACAPVWVATSLVCDWWIDRIERAFRRRMAEHGCTPDEIDQAWADITKEPTS